MHQDIVSLFTDFYHIQAIARYYYYYFKNVGFFTYIFHFGYHMKYALKFTSVCIFVFGVS